VTSRLDSFEVRRPTMAC